MLTEQDLETGLPEIVRDNDGNVNSVLAVHKTTPECGSKWQVVNAVWYCNNFERFQGFITLDA